MSKTLREMIEVMVAADKGEAIEVRERSEIRWRLCQQSCWNWDKWDYRIKPKPREIFINEYPHHFVDGRLTESWQKSRTEADDNAGGRRTAVIRFVEVERIPTD